MNFLVMLTLFLVLSLVILFWLRSLLHPIRKQQPARADRRFATTRIDTTTRDIRRSGGTSDVNR